VRAIHSAYYIKIETPLNFIVPKYKAKSKQITKKQAIEIKSNLCKYVKNKPISIEKLTNLCKDK
jgi:hypothetical protein